MSSHGKDPFLLDAGALRRACNRAASTYDAAAALQAEVRARLLERLDYVRLEPQVVIDLGAATARACDVLAQRYPQSTVVAVDFAENMLKLSRADRSPHDARHAACADAMALPFADASVDLVFCNLMLHCCNEPLEVLAECRRVLRPRGLLSLAAFGPDTLFEMRAAWAEADADSHVNRFQDMHDLGDDMLKAGLAEPVLDSEHFTLTYRTVPGIMRDLKNMGAQNVTHGRPRGLVGRARFDKVSQAYEQFRRNGRLPATYEVVYGQAWGRPARASGGGAGHETSIPVSDIGMRAKKGGG